MNVIRNITLAAIVIFIFTTCSKDGAGKEASSNGGTGTGGSLARFTIAANHLYLADWASIGVFDLANPGNPVKKADVQVGFGVETIYPYQDKLFIGSQTGMFIYSIANPSNPVKLGEARHVRSCDPVVANDTVAYVTLRGNNACGPAEDGLYIYDIKNIMTPRQVHLLRLHNPAGLGLKDSVVFVCRGNSGLSVINVKNPSSPVVMNTITGGNFIDVIPYQDQLICYISTGLLIYDISNLNQIRQVGAINY